jgi:stage V sporulation protein SpoVS
VNSIFDKLAETVFVNVNAAGLSVMNLALDNCRVSSGFDFESGNSVVVNVVFLKVSLEE